MGNPLAGHLAHACRSTWPGLSPRQPGHSPAAATPSARTATLRLSATLGAALNAGLEARRAALPQALFWDIREAIL